MKLFEISPDQEVRQADPLEDRRSGEDRRIAYDLDYFQDGGFERRAQKERRNPNERRGGCLRVSQWSSVCPPEEPQ